MTLNPRNFLDPSDVSGALRDTTTTQNAITAFAGGGQADAVLLTAVVNRITVVATAADSVKLPPARPGMSMTVFNKGANSANVFPSTGGAINAADVNAAYALAATKGATFYCAAPGIWDTVLTA